MRNLFPVVVLALYFLLMIRFWPIVLSVVFAIVFLVLMEYLLVKAIALQRREILLLLYSEGLLEFGDLVSKLRKVRNIYSYFLLYLFGLEISSAKILFSHLISLAGLKDENPSLLIHFSNPDRYTYLNLTHLWVDSESVPLEYWSSYRAIGRTKGDIGTDSFRIFKLSLRLTSDARKLIERKIKAGK